MLHLVEQLFHVRDPQLSPRGIRRELGTALQIPRENANDETAYAWPFLIQAGCDALDGVSQRQELRLPRGAFRALHAGELIQGGIADLAGYDFAVEHCELERQPFGIVTDNFSAGEGHCVLPTGGPPDLCACQLSGRRPVPCKGGWRPRREAKAADIAGHEISMWRNEGRQFGTRFNLSAQR